MELGGEGIDELFSGDCLRASSYEGLKVAKAGRFKLISLVFFLFRLTNVYFLFGSLVNTGL